MRGDAYSAYEVDTKIVLEDMKKILVLNSSYFPTGAAISSRILNFCRIFRDAGCNVHVITAHSQGNELAGKEYTIEDITYEVISKGSGNSIESFVGTPGFVHRVEEYIKTNSPDIVFMTSCVEMFRRLTGLCKKYNIDCFVEQCEWLDISNYKFRKADIRYINTEYLRRKGTKKVRGVVSISQLLNEYYKTEGVKSIRIPTILDIKGTPFMQEVCHDQKIHVVFAGSLGGSKELMKPIIEALGSDEKYRRAIQFDIYGPNRKQVISNIGGEEHLLDGLGDTVVFHGRIPQEQISSVYSNADYSIFVRPYRKSSNAGFPTKLAESMSVGTPVITNNTGDISLYLEDMKNGIFLNTNTAQAVTECFDKLISMSESQYNDLRRGARYTAEQYFDYRRYIQTLIEFFKLREV